MLDAQYRRRFNDGTLFVNLSGGYESGSPQGSIATRGQFLELANDLLYSGQLVEALKLYQQLAAESPRDPELLCPARDALHGAGPLRPSAADSE